MNSQRTKQVIASTILIILGASLLVGTLLVNPVISADAYNLAPESSTLFSLVFGTAYFLVGMLGIGGVNDDTKELAGISLSSAIGFFAWVPVSMTSGHELWGGYNILRGMFCLIAWRFFRSRVPPKNRD